MGPLVDELSKKTMGSYIKKATSDVQVANIDRGMAMSGKWTLNPKKDKIGVDAAKKGSKHEQQATYHQLALPATILS